MGCFIQACDAYGYGKSGNCSQQQNIFWYAITRGGGYQPQVYKFEQGDYVYP